MSYWLFDPELFLYAKGTGPDDVLLRRCKKIVSSSSSVVVVPMKPDDFVFVKIVKNHLELIGSIFTWDEPDYNRLVKYIYENRLLVNSQGFVFAELLHKADKDGNKKIDDADEEEVPAIYIRSLDVLPLKPYIPNLRERPIPLRTVKYLGDVNGKAAMMEEDSNLIKLTARVAHLESKNETLDTNVTKLTAGLATTTGNVADLQSKNKTLEAENKTLDLNVKTLEGKVTKLTADLATQMNALTTLQEEVKNARKEAIWMNNLTNSEWVGIEKLRADGSPHDKITIIRLKGTFTKDDNSTNVRASCCFTMKVDAITNEFKAVSLEDLTPDKEKARFLQSWWCIESQGKTYILQNL